MSANDQKAVAIVSGGLDSSVMAYTLKDQGYDLQLLSFNYGQRHYRELDYAVMMASRLGASWSLVDLSSITSLLIGSSQTDTSVEVPHGHYAAENMKTTVVPNRNAMMLSIAYAVAVAQHAGVVAFGAHTGDHAIYPDCRPSFVRSLNQALYIGNEGYADPEVTLLAPFLGLTKDQIVSRGAELNVPFELTWSCYEGNAIHCGKCGTCVERREAFILAGVKDPTVYECSIDETLALLATE